MIRTLLNHLLVRRDLLEIAVGYRDVCRQQAVLIAMKNAEIAALKLEHARWGRDVLFAFLNATDDDTLRNTLQEGLSDMADEVARLEEHHA